MLTLAFEFLRGTRRINVVHFWVDQSFELPSIPGGGGLVYVGNTYVNTAPYIPMPDLDMFFRGHHGSAASAFLDNAKMDLLMERVNSTEFFRWVDQVAPQRS